MSEKKYVKKGNKVLQVTDPTEIKIYLEKGYDLINSDGEIVERATGGKTIAVAVHNKALETIEELKLQIEELQGAPVEPPKEDSLQALATYMLNDNELFTVDQVKELAEELGSEYSNRSDSVDLLISEHWDSVKEKLSL